MKQSNVVGMSPQDKKTYTFYKLYKRWLHRRKWEKYDCYDYCVHTTHITHFILVFRIPPCAQKERADRNEGNEEVWKPLKKCPPNRETHDWKIPLQINSDANNAQKGNKIVATFNSNNKDSNSDDKTPKATYRIQYSFDYPSLVMQHFYLFVHSSYCRCRAWRILEAPLYCILTYIV